MSTQTGNTGKRRRSVDGYIEFDGDLIKLVCVRRRRGAREIADVRVERCESPEPRSQPSSSAPIDAVAAALARVVSSISVRPSRWFIVLGLHQCVIRQVRFPTTESRELAAMVRHQVLTMVPPEVDSVVSDFRVVTRDDTSSVTDVVIAPTRRVDELLSVLRRVGVEPRGFVLASDAVHAMIDMTHHSSRGAEDPEDEAVLHRLAVAVDIDCFHTTVVTSANGAVRSTRALAVGARDFKEANGSHDELMRGVRQIVSGAEVGRLTVSGAPHVRSDVARWLREESGWQVDEPECRLADRVANPHISIAALSGVVLQDPPTFDLSPDPVRQRRWRSAIAREVVSTLALTLVLGLCAVGLLASLTFRNERRIAFLEQEIAGQREIAGQLARKEERIETIERHLQRAQSPFRVIEEAYARIPGTIRLQRIAFDEGNLVLRGEANSLSEVVNLAQALDGADLFKDSNVRYASRNAATDRVDFAVDVRLAIGGDR